jgi:flagellar basal-body rod modification protein FlgD
VTAPITSKSGSSASAGATGSAQAGNSLSTSLNKDDFMKLLVAQMTHQDPLNPQDGAAMATQLAQFSSVEQLMNINKTLSSQGTDSAGVATAINNSAAIGLLGKDVTVMSGQIRVGGTGAATKAATDIPASGGKLTMRITDASGNPVTSVDLGSVSGGRQSFNLDAYTKGLPAGTYGVAFDLTSGSGAAAAATHPTTLVTVHVDGVKYTSQGAQVTAGGLTYPISGIVSIDTTN